MRLRGFDHRHQSLVGRDGWERRERTAFDDLHRAGGDGRNGKYHGRGSRVGDRWSGCCVLDVVAAFWGWRWHILEGFIWEFCRGQTLCLSGKWVESCFAGKCYALFACWRVMQNGMVQAGLWRIVCAMQHPCRRLEPVSYCGLTVQLYWWAKTHRMDGFGAGTGIGGSCICWQVESPCSAFTIRYRKWGENCGRGIWTANNAGQTDGSSILNFSGISGGMTGYGMAAAIRSGVSRGVFSMRRAWGVWRCCMG